METRVFQSINISIVLDPRVFSLYDPHNNALHDLVILLWRSLVNRRLFQRPKSFDANSFAWVMTGRAELNGTRRAPLKRKNSDFYYLGTYASQKILVSSETVPSRRRIVSPFSEATFSTFPYFNLQDSIFLSFQNDENFFTQLLSITRAVLLSKASLSHRVSTTTELRRAFSPT